MCTADDLIFERFDKERTETVVSLTRDQTIPQNNHDNKIKDHRGYGTSRGYMIPYLSLGA